MEEATITSRVVTCVENFEELYYSGRLAAREAEVPTCAWYDELGRLRVWVVTTGAHLENNRSLDHRLRDAPYSKAHVIRVLDRLQRILEDIDLELKGLLDEEDYTSDGDEENPVYGIQPIYNNMVDCINCLNRTSYLIDQPAPPDNTPQAADWSPPRSVDLLDSPADRTTSDATDLYSVPPARPQRTSSRDDHISLAIDHHLASQNKPYHGDDHDTTET